MSRKDYKQGIADAMGAYEAFGEKQETAIRHVGAEIEKTAGKVDKLGGKIGEIADYITDKEKAELYKLNTPVDIADLDNAEKRILLAVLYQLSADEDEVTEEQQNYLRAVQQYLKIYNPQTEIDLDAVENIEDISAQKAVLQAVLEFFRLGTHPKELTKGQEDFLDCFQVNRRTRREIDGFISAIVEAVGIKGLAEKYGFVDEQPRSEFAKYQDNGRIPEMVADVCIAQFKEKEEDDYSDDDEEYGVSRIRDFENGQTFLETKDYIVFLKVRGTVYDEEEDYDFSADEESGLFRVDKQNGKVERIPLDYEKNIDLFVKWYYLGYCIVKNMIYLVNRVPDKEKKVNVLAVDISEKTSRILTIPYTVQYYKCRTHISANESYLMVAILETDRSYNSTEPVKTYVVDLTQNDRTFVLTPGLTEVYDGFLWEGKFLFWGAKKQRSGGLTPDSLYQYDPQNKTLEDIFPEGMKYSGFGRCAFSPQRKEYLPTIDQMLRIDDSYSFWFSLYKSDYSSDTDFQYLMLQKEKGKWNGHGSGIYRPVASLPDGELVVFKHDVGLILTKTNYLTGKATYPAENDKDADAYILLGDYLYRYYSSEGWQKANISNGWDNLQWEVFQMPD